MSRKIKLYYPQSNMPVSLSFCFDAVHDDQSRELWVDSCELWNDVHNRHTSDKTYDTDLHLDPRALDHCDRLVVYDWMHADSRLKDYQISWLQNLSRIKPLLLITVNPKPIPDVCSIHFDYCWNRCRRAFVDRHTFHRLGKVENFVQYPIYCNFREKKYLNYFQNGSHYVELIQQYLTDKYPDQGFVSDKKNNRPLVPNYGRFRAAEADPPARYYFDESYITCVTESQHLGSQSLVVTEKTYDHIIQGRCVINFAPQGFYQHLKEDGWQLPSGIDWSWNDIFDDKARLAAYLDQLDLLLQLPMEKLHDWFHSNMSVWMQNQRMLYDKPYDTLDFDLWKEHDITH